MAIGSKGNDTTPNKINDKEWNNHNIYHPTQQQEQERTTRKLTRPLNPLNFVSPHPKPSKTLVAVPPKPNRFETVACRWQHRFSLALNAIQIEAALLANWQKSPTIDPNWTTKVFLVK
jgi:hypothetical protein